MPATWRMRRRPRTGVVSVLLTLGIVAGMLAGAGRALAAGPSYVKYYVVAATYQGKPENLSEIAGRFLGSTARSGEIFSLSADVVQPGGGKLTDPAGVHAGWVLVLPWDAAGSGVQYGLLPTAAPATGPSRPATRPTPAVQTPTAPASGAAAGACAGSPKNTIADSQADWATLRLAPQHAWTHGRGGGVMVAIVDSGIDASRAELAGRVTVGADIITGTGRGSTDCVGSGTAMAGIVAARSDDASGGVGMAPAATVMPVRVAPTDAAVSEPDQASAIAVAVSAGATVIALGGYIDPNLPAVADAIEQAAGHNVVVVTGAPTRSSKGGGRAATSPASPAGVIRTGAIDINGAPGATYQPGAVDVVAPGVGVASLGISGTGRFVGSGTQYAVAFVAGEVALVRAMYPNLTAAQVVRRVEATADRMGSAAPDATFGWGLINPGAALTQVIADEGRTPDASTGRTAPSTGWSSARTAALVIMVILALSMVLLVVLRIRRMVLPTAPGADAAATDPTAGVPAAGLPGTGAAPAGAGTTGPVDSRSAGAVLLGAESVGSRSSAADSADAPSGQSAPAASTRAAGGEAGGQPRSSAAHPPPEPGPDGLAASPTQWRRPRSSRGA